MDQDEESATCVTFVCRFTIPVPLLSLAHFRCSVEKHEPYFTLHLKRKRSGVLRRPEVVAAQHASLHRNTVHRQSLNKMRARPTAVDLTSHGEGDYRKRKKQRLDPQPANRIEALKQLEAKRRPAR